MTGILPKLSIKIQFFIATAIVLLVLGLCFLATGLIGYKIVALILLVVVSLQALLFDIIPVVFCALLSAFIWNFFFIPPRFTFHIADTEDLLMFFLYFLIALVHAVLTFKIRQAEKRANLKKENERAVKLYHAVFNSLSHELRTPISTLIGAVDTLKNPSNTLNPHQESVLLGEIETAGLRLNQQVENLLNISRLESGMIQPKTEWCDIQELINSVIQELNYLSSRQINVLMDKDFPLIKIDIGIMELVLFNLIHNAIQHTETDTRIELEAKIDEENIFFSVRDYGIGVSEKDLEYIFQKFYRSSDNKSSGGIGLGLSIVKGFIESLNGTVTAYRTDPNGLTVAITVPCEISYINRLKNE